MQQTKRNTMTQIITNYIKEQIRDGKIKSGERINIEELARNLSSSKTPVRSALESLVAEGMISYQVNSGFFVKRLSLKEYLQIYELQEMIETYLIEKMMQYRNLIDTSKMREINEKIGDAIEKKSVARTLSELNDSFHMEIYKNYPNPKILYQLRNIWNIVALQREKMYESPIFFQMAVQEHEEIISAIENGSKKDARETMAKHFFSGRTAVMYSFKD